MLVNILGFYSGLTKNSVIVKVEPYYEIAILYFNIIRSAWAPFSDLLRIEVFDDSGNVIGESFIEYHRRDEIDPEVNRVVCNTDKTPKINDKFQINIAINPASNTKSLKVMFEGMVFSGAHWGISNVHLVYGCDNFMGHHEESHTCLHCKDGYYKVFDNTVEEICRRCPANCLTCTSSENCQSCE